MTLAPLRIRLDGPGSLTLTAGGEEIVARLWLNGTEVPPTVRAIANDERVRFHAGVLHIHRTGFQIPAEHHAAVTAFLEAAKAQS